MTTITLLGQEQLGFSLNLLDEVEEAGQLWLNYGIELHLNGKKRAYSNNPVTDSSLRGSEAAEAIPPLVALSDQTVGRFRFNLKPHNELERLSKQILDFIANPKRSELFFEPADPSFELHIQRSSHSLAANQVLNTFEEEFKVYLWIDGGNSTKLEYTWDAEGMRLMVTAEALRSFANTLLLGIRSSNSDI